MTEKEHYKAFISYAHTDQKIARRLHHALERYKVPKELDENQRLTSDSHHRLGSFFLDRAELSAADDLSAAVQDALARSDYLIVICSPEAARSHWVNEEILTFKRLRGEANVRCCIAAGEPLTIRRGLPEAQECFAPALRYHINADGQLSDDPAEPIAADTRPQGDGRRLALLKIVAGLLDVSLDTLVQRQTHRHNRQLIGLFSVTFAVLVMVTFLMFSALKAREEAGAAKQMAQERNASAENLLEFMLGDLRTKLEPASKLDVLGAIGQEALDYYASRPASEFDTGSLARRARALRLLAEIQVSRGDLTAAQGAFIQSRETTAELLARAPEDTARIFDHAQSSYWVARMEWRRGDLVAAEVGLRDYLTLAERLTKLEPQSPSWTQELGYAYSSLGTIFMERGKWQSAKTEFDKANTAFSSLVAAQPDEISFQVDLGDVQSWLASANLRTGHFDRALEHRLEQIRIHQDILRAHPEIQSAGFDLVPAYMHLGRLTYLMGDADRALNELKEAEALGRKAVTRDPDLAAAAEILAKTFLHQAEAYIALNQYEEAVRALSEAEVLSDKLLSLNGQDLKWKVELHERSQTITARVLRVTDHTEAGFVLIKSCVASLSDIRQAHPDNRIVTLQLAESITIAVQFETARGNVEEARAMSQDVVDLLTPIGIDLQPTGQAFLAWAYFSLGRFEEAAAVSEILDESGFAHPDFTATKSALKSNSR